MNKWPDGTPKSANNAFDWRAKLPKTAKPAKAPNLKVQLEKRINFTVYSRAGYAARTRSKT